MSATILDFRPRSSAQKDRPNRLVGMLKQVAAVAAELAEDHQASPEERGLGRWLSIHCRYLARLFTTEAPTHKGDTT